MKVNIEIYVSGSGIPIHQCKSFDNSNLTVNSKKDGSILDKRITIDGDLKFFGSDYDYIFDVLSDYRIIEFSYVEDGELIAIGTFDKYYKQDVHLRVSSVKLTVVDKYSLFDKFSDTKYNVAAVKWATDRERGLWGEANFNLEFFPMVHELSVPLLYDSGNWISHPDIQATKPNDAAFIYVFYDNGDSQNPIVTSVQWAISVGYGYYQDGIAQQPSSGTWYYLRDEVFNGVTFPVFALEIIHDRPYYGGWVDPEFYSWDDVNFVWLPSEYSIAGQWAEGSVYGNLFKYTFIRDLKDVFKYIINKIDNSVLFDNTSFASFDNLTGEEITHALKTDYSPLPAYVSDKPYKDAIFMSLSDFIPKEDGTQQDFPSTIINLTWNYLWAFFEQKGFFWYLNGKVFIIKHYTEISFVNRSKFIPNDRQLQVIDYQIPSYFKIHNTESGSGIEFVGTDMIFENTDSKDSSEYGQTQIHCDLNDIRTQKSAAYDDLDNEQFVIICADYDQVNQIRYVRAAHGLLTGNPVNNCELGWPYVQKNLISKLPTNKAIVNGNLETVNNNRLEKFKQIKIEMPYSSVDFTKNLFIFETSNEIVSESHKSDGRKSELTIKRL